MRFHPLIEEDQVQEGFRRRFQVQGQHLLLLHHDGRDWLVENLCPHMGFALDEGEVRDGAITCPHHRFVFDLASGEPRTQGIFCDPMRRLPAHRQDGWVGLDENELADWL